MKYENWYLTPALSCRQERGTLYYFRWGFHKGRPPEADWRGTGGILPASNFPPRMGDRVVERVIGHTDLIAFQEQ